MDLEIALIGAVSPPWGFTLMRDIVVLLSEEAGLAERRALLVLEDVDEVNLEKVHRLAAANREWIHPGLLHQPR